jgi:DNA replication and repair protein RecF
VSFLRDYTSALKQRNRLLLQGGRGGPLRGGAPVPDDELGVWEAILARAGAELDRRREGLARDLHAVMRDLASRVDPALAPLLEYVTSGWGVGIGTPGIPTVEQRAERLAACRSRDQRLGWTGDGPHRARLICKIGGMELAEGASRGYSRLYSILLRLALAQVLEQRLDEAPVVLLDDPESELDARWIGALLALVPESSQMIVTGCRPLSTAPPRMVALPIESLAALAVAGAGVAAA